MISIVTVTLNNLNGLKKTMSSILGQNFSDFQVIIKDGISTDGSLEYLNKNINKDNRFTLISNKDNGIYDAMNIALRNINRKYVIFLNSGDIFSSKDVLQQFHAFQKNNNYDIYFGNSIMNINGTQYKRISKNINYIKYGQPALHQSTIYKSDLHKKFYYMLEYKISSDYATTLKMYKNGAKVINYPYVISIFDVNDKSKSYVNQKISRMEIAKAQKEILNLNFMVIFLYKCRRFAMNKLMKILYNIK